MKKNSLNFNYGSVFMLSSLFWSGNCTEYFIQHSKKIVVLYFLPRWEKKNNFVKIYKNGKCVKEYELFSPKNILVQYVVLYFQYLNILFTHFKKTERFYIITYHPICFLFNSVIRFFRNFDIVFWITDYIPNSKYLGVRIYQNLISRYHRKNMFNVYLSDRINKVMNGRVLNNFSQKTISWGIKVPKYYKKKLDRNFINLFYTGNMIASHGVDILLELVKNHKKLKIKLLGKCSKELSQKYEKFIKRNSLEKRVYFPNRYIELEDLISNAKECLAGVALYNTSNNNFNYYADPGKVKMYAEFGLPIIMTRCAQVSDFIEKFKAGLIVERNSESLYKACIEIKKDYKLYIEGLRKFNDHFNYQKYYEDKFLFMENNK